MKKVWFYLIILSLIGGCAHFRSSKYIILKEPDFYHGKTISSQAKIGVMPFYIRQWRTVYSSDLLAQMEELRSRLNLYLREKHLLMLPQIKMDTHSYPIAYFGVVESIDFPGDQESPQIASYDEVEKPLMAIYQETPAKEWKDSLKAYCARKKVDYVLTPFLSIGDFKVYQKDWKGNKEIVLGTNYRVPVPWLTALDEPVEVLYLGAALVNCEGKIIKVGAEGLFAKKPKFLLSVMSLQSAITAEDVTALLEARREDLSGQPLIWKAALDNLLQNMMQ